MTIWILIWRLNPPHIWHMRILDESLKKNSKTLLFLWSSNILDKNNPYSYNERKDMINILYWNNTNLIIENIDDISKDKDWVLNIKKKLNKYISDKNTKIIFYGWDFQNDYAIQVIKDYSHLFSFENILFREISRKDIIVNYNNKKIEVSSTKVRETIKNKDKDLLKKLVDERIIRKF